MASIRSSNFCTVAYCAAPPPGYRTSVNCRIVDGPRSKIGARFAEFLVGVLEDAESRRIVTSMVRAAATEPQAATMVRELVTERVLEPIAEALESDQPALRAGLINTQMVGVVVARYIVGVEPIASLPPDELARAIAPNLQHYLVGRLGTVA